jgi:methyltransferase (TIGR00027 family)
MGNLDPRIGDVSDTSLWVAYYRAEETRRPDALFQDPLAARLIGERGKVIADDMEALGRYVRWSVVGRTVIIDAFVEQLVAEGVDLVINLGAGLDTRPYRMNLPTGLRWIEVDYPHIVGLKNDRLAGEKPRCDLHRVEMDLADRQTRAVFFKELGASCKKAVVLTEGVLPYLSEEEVGALADDLRNQATFKYWVTEFFDPKVYRYLKASVRTQKMVNAPFRFYPKDWTGFFVHHGWREKQTRYLNEEALRLKRPVPMPWFGRLFMLFLPAHRKQEFLRVSGYRVLEK